MKGFFERASCPREKRRTSMCGALRVCRHRQGRLDPWKLKATATATATARVTLPATPTRACGRSGAPTSSVHRSEEHTSELQSLMRISYAVFCLKKKTHTQQASTHQ